MKQNGASFNTESTAARSARDTDEKESVKDSIETLFASTGDYVETRIDLAKLKAIDKTSDIVSTLASKFIVIAAFFMFAILVNIGIALLLGAWMGKSYYGFLSLAAVYLIAALIFKSNEKKWFKEPIADSLIKKFF